MRRRDFIKVIAAPAAAWPLAARAQPAVLPRRVGFLLVGFSPDSKAAQFFRRGLHEAGYTEGRDVVIEWRAAQGDYSRVPGLIEDLVQKKVEIIVQDSTVGTEVAKRMAPTIPIVMALVLDPVGSGLVKSLANPGGNVTGLSMMTTVDLNSKRLQLLKEMIPGLTRAAVIWNPDHPLHRRAVEELKAIGPSLSIDLSYASVRTPDQFAPAFAEMERVRAQAVYVIDDPIFFAHRTTLLQLAAAARLPTMHDLRRFPEIGALMSYGPDVYDLFRRSATYVDRILKGAKPTDLPVEQPTKFELVINLKTAKALGLTVPPSLLVAVDELIE
ncbi:MAG TPA: ABC transporter substrate-binding protein [Pseudolabrys sp.]|nr:ABC transporter substrate-binding protein [Pseudolabrys sp.]